MLNNLCLLKTPLAPYTGTEIAEKIAIVPVLRSGLGMVEPLLELLPHAEVHHIGDSLKKIYLAIL